MLQAFRAEHRAHLETRPTHRSDLVKTWKICTDSQVTVAEMHRSCWFDVDSIWFWWWIRVTALWVRSEGEISEFWVVRRVRTLEERHEVSALFWVLALYPEVIRFVCSWNCQEMSRVKIVSIVKGPRAFNWVFIQQKLSTASKNAPKTRILEWTDIS